MLKTAMRAGLPFWSFCAATCLRIPSLPATLPYCPPCLCELKYCPKLNFYHKCHLLHEAFPDLLLFVISVFRLIALGVTYYGIYTLLWSLYFFFFFCKNSVMQPTPKLKFLFAALTFSQHVAGVQYLWIKY